MDAELIAALRMTSSYLLSLIPDVTPAMVPPTLSHYFYGHATGSKVYAVIPGVLSVECPIIGGTYGYDMNALQIPGGYGTVVGGLPGMYVQLFVASDPAVKATVPFQHGGLTEIDL